MKELYKKRKETIEHSWTAKEHHNLRYNSEKKETKGDKVGLTLAAFKHGTETDSEYPFILPQIRFLMEIPIIAIVSKY